MPNRCFITSIGKFLPGDPVGNDEMEARLGMIGGKPSRSRERVLRQNGIRQRHYAIDENQQTRYTNAQMAAHAVRDAVHRSTADLKEVGLLTAATSQGDLPLPGFASMVHGELDLPACEIATLHGICASSVVALKHAAAALTSPFAPRKGGIVLRSNRAQTVARSERRRTAACVASEFPSRLLKASRYEAQGYGETKRLRFETEFLRWMLSDGAGAFLLSDGPREDGLSLEIEHIALKSHANAFPPCMFVGSRDDVSSEETRGWLDYPDYATAAAAGAINLHQRIDLLEDVVRLCVNGVFELVEDGLIDPRGIDWWVTHYSSQIFRYQALELFERGGLTIPRDRIFSNLATRGNMGAASFPLLLEELFWSGRLEPGQRLLCIVPESGRFLFGYVVLKVICGAEGGWRRAEIRRQESEVGGQTSEVGERPEDDSPVTTHHSPTTPPDIKTSGADIEESLVRKLSAVWTDFEARLNRVPVIAKMHDGRLTLADYRELLFNLRQQVIDGSRWISRAASNITREHFAIRSAFIGHSSDEHRDFEMIERDYVSVGGKLDDIQNGEKNIGSTALSEYILSRASRENPFDLIGAMFIIEGLGRRVARRWAGRIRQQLDLEEEQVSFLMYHSESDDIHFARLDAAVQSGVLTESLVAEIVKTAKVVARLYVLQLEELGNV